jgi:Flp pilus assembly protein TadD
LAKHKLREGDYQAAVDLCDQAETVNKDGAGVKSLRATATSKLRQQ